MRNGGNHLLVVVLNLYKRVALHPAAPQPAGTLVRPGREHAAAAAGAGHARHAPAAQLPVGCSGGRRWPIAPARQAGGWGGGWADEQGFWESSPHARLNLAVRVGGLRGAAGHAGKELPRRPRLPRVGAELHQYSADLLQLHAAGLKLVVARGGRLAAGQMAKACCRGGRRSLPGGRW